MMEKEIYHRIYSSIEELPTLPVVIPKLLRVFEDKNYNAANFAKLISSDSALTSKILKIANSAYYGFSRQISSLEYAILLLGLNMVKSLALSIGVMSVIPGGRGSKLFNPEKLWVHNIAVATVMEKIGKKVKGVGEDKPLFVIGLLHDVGKIVFNQFFNDQFCVVMEKIKAGTFKELHVAEKEFIGADHNEVGAMLFKRWNFPEDIIVPIKLHHRMERFKSSYSLEISILRIGNIIPQQVDIGSDGNFIPPEISANDLENTGLSQADVDKLREELLERREAVEAFLT